MTTATLFRVITTSSISLLIGTAQQRVCYAGPGIHLVAARAIVDVARSLGPEMVTVCLDFDEQVMRMGYGDIEAVRIIRDAGICVTNAPGMRTALVIVDDEGFIFTPTALYLEPEPSEIAAPNGMHLSAEQVTEALARLSPVAKAIAIAQARTPAERAHLEALPVEVGADELTSERFDGASENLKAVPPVQFDLARQVRVFEPYLQYVEVGLTGVAIQRNRLPIPANITSLGSRKELKGRLKTTFELIERDSKLSSKHLEDELNGIRKDMTRSLGKSHGRVMLKNAKPLLAERLTTLRAKLELHQKAIEAGLQKHLDNSRKQIVDYYLPLVVKNPPDALRAQLFGAKDLKEGAKAWLNHELDRVMPRAENLVQEMRLEESYKDVTYETLKAPDFLKAVKEAYPLVNWDAPYAEFLAAGEADAGAHPER